MKPILLNASEGECPNERRKTDALMDRRSGNDRREVYDVDYFENGGTERRKGTERRRLGERRKGWIRLNRWSSVRPDTGREEDAYSE